jgi:molecular chaperone GrpE (heat shock protein)
MSELEDGTNKTLIQNEKKTLLEPSWPSGLLEKYHALPLPNMHDIVLSQEKLAAEIRKQNKELKNNNETIKQLSTQVEDMRIHIQNSEDTYADKLSENEGFEKDCIDENNASNLLPAPILQQILMQAMDAQFTLLTALEKSREHILSIVPEKTGFWRYKKPEWRRILENILDGYTQGIATARQKLLAQLADAEIELICPISGNPFDPRIHRAVERMEGEAAGCIAEVIRYGYMSRGRVLRYADVSVY